MKPLKYNADAGVLRLHKEYSIAMPVVKQLRVPPSEMCRALLLNNLSALEEGFWTRDTLIDNHILAKLWEELNTFEIN